MRTSGVIRNSRKAANLSLDSDILQLAKKLEINISRAAQRGIEIAIAERQAELWYEENQDALESSNKYVAEHGIPLAEYRNF
ncbi:type II toxin-antitoxin system CcdA family antitoxin [Chrysiogenes arsenatis]|uniref:type II toxin-antitoxin system CcdA family antitoxin n=1 Tax=Chrysiogenes arsenatis TaxID=309797 RepID=UPI000421596D|nr:type II toxin-antitoxin system CcdA family antitoxin [Chrysiogenes arsenatis]